MPSLSRGRQAARALDGHAGLRDALFEIANERGHWAGIPMPLDGERLIIEPTFPHAEALMGMGKQPDSADDEGWRLRNQWYSRHHRCDILIMEKNGKIDWGKLPAFHHISHDLSTLGCSEAWGIEQEGRAIDLLGKLLRHRQFKQYLMTGMFLETSKRSGVTYLFRRLKPTVALRPGRTDRERMRILCALCMHPIAYYAGSWAGAMCPTDDVIAHLSLMRGDEAMFWRRSNQHPPYRPEAGL
ncbi:hypothetical protein C8K11_1342 [Novosphingobium sp. GV055]|nr:hypothetical protein C8K11_1342 [Novosphingobium sp. GV055]PUA93939.1 hypothetical protein C8K12_1342 [Novosphingobium sp. GV061]PUB11356.1 hypothetical protein C8K14_1342 [Novosphingobium sp. GV079]PUB37046.1 hypothetical protein C8K10_1342 [Novosphingobium sp. GV027]